MSEDTRAGSNVDYVKIRVYILTTSCSGTAAVVLPELLKAKEVEVAGIVVNKGQRTREQKRRSRVRILRKILSIGLVGAVNGVRMRRWYANTAVRLKVPLLTEQAELHGIPLLTIDNLKDARLLQFIESKQCDVGLSLGNGYLPKAVYSLTPQGMLNIHHEVLPDFRGAQSVIWQLYEGSAETGFTIHRIDDSIDTGPIVCVERMPIIFRQSLSETVAVTYAELNRRSGIALATILASPKSIAEAKMQADGRRYTTPSGFQFVRIMRNYRTLRDATVGLRG